MPAILLIILSFTLIVLLMRFKIPLFAALLVSCLFVMLYVRTEFSNALAILGNTLTDQEVISLCIIIALILLFSDALKVGSRLDRIVAAFENLKPGNRFKLIAFPALIGLLPMPGGAVFSAPMVEATGRNMKTAPGWFSAVNYWFRHVWEYWWPLYPGVLIAISLSKIPIGTYTLLMMPFSVVAITAGIITILPGKITHSLDASNGEEKSLKNTHGDSISRRKGIGILLRELTPITIVVIGGVGLELGREFLESAGVIITQPLSRSAIILSLIVALIYTFKNDIVPIKTLLRDWAKKQNVEMIAMIILVVFYKNTLDSVGLIDKTVNELHQWNVPLWGVITILPFLLGLITGIQFAAVGVSFPVILGLASKAGLPVSAVVPYAYVLAFMGTMVSPVHFCLLLTKEYFHDGFEVVYKRILIPVLIMLITVACLTSLYVFLFSQGGSG